MAHLGLENHDLQRILVAYQNMMGLSVAKISLQTLISNKHEISHPAPKFALPNLKAFESKFLSFLNLDSAKINEKELLLIFCRWFGLKFVLAGFCLVLHLLCLAYLSTIWSNILSKLKTCSNCKSIKTFKFSNYTNSQINQQGQPGLNLRLWTAFFDDLAIDFVIIGLNFGWFCLILLCPLVWLICSLKTQIFNLPPRVVKFLASNLRQFQAGKINFKTKSAKFKIIALKNQPKSTKFKA